MWRGMYICVARVDLLQRVYGMLLRIQQTPPEVGGTGASLFVGLEVVKEELGTLN